MRGGHFTVTQSQLLGKCDCLIAGSARALRAIIALGTPAETKVPLEQKAQSKNDNEIN